ncbi:MAG: hypothetical protein K6F99_04785 [Lachnospiraceae bacterium]|nr:hypothetical protein [Lachnospiraceae bacterium]
MTDEERNENDVFNQEIADEEMERAAGGAWIADKDESNCTTYWRRNIYEGEFPNCASTVENNSHCWGSDACMKCAIDYKGLQMCFKAWK